MTLSPNTRRLGVGFAAALVLGVTACQRGGSPAVPEVAPEPAVFSWRPFTGTYGVTAHSTTFQDIPGEPQRTESAVAFDLLVTIGADSVGRIEARMVVDTVVEAQLAGVTANEALDVGGTEYGAVIDTNGAYQLLEAPRSRLRDAIANRLRRFLPSIPVEGFVAGDRWVDTTETVELDGSMTRTKLTETHSVAGTWSDSLPRTLVVDWTSQYTVEGTGRVMGQPFALAGRGEGRGQYRLHADGSLLEAFSRDSSNAEITVDAMGLTIPVWQVAADTVRLRPDSTITVAR